MIPLRIAFFPWLMFPQSGTIAADTRCYPFGARIVVPGYGRGIVEDRGSAIRGPDRLEVFFRSHCRARQWGRRRVEVEIRRRE
jgi:3D (Asp-Asp-Asp) domain-containing protein